MKLNYNIIIILIIIIVTIVIYHKSIEGFQTSTSPSTTPRIDYTSYVKLLTIEDPTHESQWVVDSSVIDFDSSSTSANGIDPDAVLLVGTHRDILYEIDEIIKMELANIYES
jgi:hypothetical protein